MERFRIKQFTEDIDAMKTFISETEADGGDDLAEDLTGALGKALKMNW